MACNQFVPSKINLNIINFLSLYDFVSSKNIEFLQIIELRINMLVCGNAMALVAGQ
jgi:hypothetical protein